MNTVIIVEVDVLGYDVAGITDIMEDEVVAAEDLTQFRPFELKLVKIIKKQ